jgi:hypothetical protein
MRGVLVVCTLAACGGSKPAATTPAQPDHRFVLQVGGSVTSQGATAPLVTTKEIHKGDELYLTLATTKRTKLYVAYCDSQQHMAIYPPTGNLSGEPGIVTRVPESGSFKTDEHTGLEHMFVIATAAELDRSDPKLHELLARAQGAAGTQCTTEVAKTIAPPPEPAAAPRATPVGGAGVEKDTANQVAAAAPDDQAGAAAFPTEAGVWRPRGFDVSQGATDTSSSSSDDTGIAIWAITLSHK